MERIIKTVNEIINDLETLSNLPVYSDIKLMDGTQEFIVLNYAMSESAWSNNKVDAYIIDISILVSRKTSLDLIETIDAIYKNTNFDLVATGINKDHFNHEAIMYTCKEVVINEF